MSWTRTHTQLPQVDPRPYMPNRTPLFPPRVVCAADGWETRGELMTSR